MLKTIRKILLGKCINADIELTGVMHTCSFGLQKAPRTRSVLY
jgi:hypothetical protein